jgi:hypothetical protein
VCPLVLANYFLANMVHLHPTYDQTQPVPNGYAHSASDGELRIGVPLAMDGWVIRFTLLRLTDAPIDSMSIDAHSKVAIVLLR